MKMTFALVCLALVATASARSGLENITSMIQQEVVANDDEHTDVAGAFE
jgi:hypothetical protein